MCGVWLCVRCVCGVMVVMMLVCVCGVMFVYDVLRFCLDVVMCVEVDVFL